MFICKGVSGTAVISKILLASPAQFNLAGRKASSNELVDLPFLWLLDVLLSIVMLLKFLVNKTEVREKDLIQRRCVHVLTEKHAFSPVLYLSPLLFPMLTSWNSSCITWCNGGLECKGRNRKEWWKTAPLVFLSRNFKTSPLLRGNKHILL